MIVCVCTAVSELEICQAIRAGATDLFTLRGACGAGSGCGACQQALQALLDAHVGDGTQGHPAADALASTLTVGYLPADEEDT